MTSNEAAWSEAKDAAHRPPSKNPLLDFWHALVEEATRDDREQGK
jgi:hypothetical protein